MNVGRKYLCLLAMSGALSACSTFSGEGDSVAATGVPVAEQSPDQSATAKVEHPKRTPPGNGWSKNAAATIEIGSGDFVSGDDLKIGGAEIPQGTVTLNFDNADLKEVIGVVLGETLGLSYVLDPRVGGTVTFRSSAPVSYQIALESLEIILRMNNAALVPSGDVFTIVPANEAALSALPPRLLRNGGDVPAGYSIALIPLQHVGAAKIKELIEPFLPQGSIKRVDPERNLLLVAGAGPDLANIVQTVRAFDVDWLKARSVGIFPLQHTEPAAIIRELITILDTDENGKGPLRLMPIERQNAILVVANSQSLLSHVERWIEKLDLGTGDGERLYVYYVQNAKAADLADLLGELFGNDSQIDRQSGGNVAPGRTPVKVDASGVSEISGADASSIRLSGGNEIRFVADETTNALMIVATPADYSLIESAIKKIDIEPLQVLIEATIAEVTLGDEFKFGLQWAFESGDLGLNGGSGRGVLSSGDSGTIGSIFPGFSFILSDATGARAVLDAIATETEVDVISSPTLLVLDNQTASLQIGDEVPITTLKRQGTDDPLAPILNSVEYQDTGVILEVTPNVSSSGNVILEIAQEVSNVSESVDSGVLTPTISQRKVKTVVSVRSGETIILGGLISNLKSRTKRGVPVLSDIPVLGALFGGREIKSTRKELILLLTPKVLYSPEDARRATEELKATLETLKALESEPDANLLIEMLAK